MKFFLVVLIFLLIAFYTFGLSVNAFFQQDEWQFFGAFIYSLSSKNPLANVALPFGGELTHFYPLANLFFLLEYLLFKMNYSGYAYVGIFLHFLNSIFIYLIFRKLTKKSLLSFAASAIFLVNLIPHQAITWVMINASSLTATLFALISIYLFVHYLEAKKFVHFFFCVLSLSVSLLFKEISVFLFLFYFLVLFFVNFRNSKFNLSIFLKKDLLFLGGLGFLYFLLRLVFLSSDVRSVQPEVVDVSTAPVWVYFYRFFTVPLKGLSQSLIPQEVLIKFSEWIASGWRVDDRIVQGVVYEYVSYFFTFLILVFIFLAWKKFIKTERRIANVLSVFLVFGFLSLFPFSFIPGKAGYFSIFEPRNLYIPFIFSSFLISLFLSELVKMLNKRFQNAVFLIALGCTLFVGSQKVRSDINTLVEQGRLRRSFLEKITKDYPNLGDNVVFYTESDRAYYGMPDKEKILPVQTGFGRMILVWYQDKKKFPSCFYEDQFLHDLLAQGYKFCRGHGLGYYRNFSRMKEEIKSVGFTPDDVIAYSWDSGDNSFENITEVTREKLKNEF